MQPDQTTVTLSRPGSKSQPAQEIVIPTTLGSVKILTPIGQGGMGIVYRARDELLNRDVAVKFLTNAIAAPDDPNFTTFLEGARSAADRDAARRAASPFSYLFLTMPVYLLILLLAGIALHRLIPFRTLSIIAAIIAITLPPLIWARAITADRAHRIFPNPALAAVLLLAAILAHMLLFTVCNLTANSLLRLVLDQHRS
jgi:hypothetical protein